MNWQKVTDLKYDMLLTTMNIILDITLLIVYILFGLLLSRPFHLLKGTREFFAAAQESFRNDVKRAFGVLQAQFAKVRRPAWFWDVETWKYMMTTSIVLHNMIAEDE